MNVSDFSLRSRQVLVTESDGSLRWTAARIDVRRGTIARIDEVGLADAPPDASAEGPTVYELGERLVVPAFVNTHTHLALHGLRGTAADLRGNVVEDLFYRWESALTADDVRAFARLGALECALHGTGAVFDHYYFADAIAEALRDVGLAGVVAPTLQDRGGPQVQTVDEALETTDALLGDAWRRAGIVPALGPHATDTVTAELWGEALDLAEENDLPLHAHVAQSAEEVRRCFERHGRSPLHWMQHEGLLDSTAKQLLVHALFVDDADLARLDPARQVLGACPFSQIKFGFPAAVERWNARGLPWVTGTDCAPTNDSMNVQKELRLIGGQSAFDVTYGSSAGPRRASIEAKTVDATEAARTHADAALRDPRALLASVWSTPGDFHAGLQTGAVSVGRRADLAIFDPHHPSMWPGDDALAALAYADPSPALHGLLVGGRWVGEPGDVAAILRRDEVRDWVDEATRRAAEVRARIH